LDSDNAFDQVEPATRLSTSVPRLCYFGSRNDSSVWHVYLAMSPLYQLISADNSRHFYYVEKR